jgi:hypothetical protein
MTKRKKLIIIIVISLFVWVGLVVLIVRLTGQNQNKASNTGNHIVIIDNAAQYEASGLSNDFLNIVEPAIYTATQNNVSHASNVYDGTIRGGSFTVQGSGAVSFLLDIPSVKLSWYVVQGQSDPSVSCVTKTQAKWPLPAKCVDLSTILTNQASDTPNLGAISQYLPVSDVSYTMDAGYSPTDGTKLAILVTCYATTCQQDVEAQIKSLGFNPATYQIVYTKAY